MPDLSSPQRTHRRRRRTARGARGGAWSRTRGRWVGRGSSTIAVCGQASAWAQKEFQRIECLGERLRGTLSANRSRKTGGPTGAGQRQVTGFGKLADLERALPGPGRTQAAQEPCARPTCQGDAREQGQALQGGLESTALAVMQRGPAAGPEGACRYGAGVIWIRLPGCLQRETAVARHPLIWSVAPVLFPHHGVPAGALLQLLPSG